MDELSWAKFDTTAELQRSVAAMKLAVDPKVGIVRSARFAKLMQSEPRTFLCYAYPASIFPLAGIEGSNQGGACAVSAERAFLRACGEAIERYCSSFTAEEQIIVYSEEELRQIALPYYSARRFYPFADKQYTATFPFDRPDERRDVRWVYARNFETSGTVLVPASCVFVPYRFDKRVEAFSHLPISTGLACGPSLSFAIQKGILEILERDALMISWHRRLPCARINPASCLGKSQDIDILLGAAGPEDAEWHLNLLTLDVDVPIVSAALINPRELPKTSFGVAADLDPEMAILRAMEEALLSRFLLNRANLGDVSSETVLLPRTLRQHMVAHAVSPRLRESLLVLIDAPVEVTYSELASRWNCHDRKGKLSDRLMRCNLRALYLDITTPDVRDIGLSVVRVLIPEAQPLDNDHLYPYLGGKRLTLVPTAMGFGDRSDIWNPDPHPFP